MQALFSVNKMSDALLKLNPDDTIIATINDRINGTDLKLTVRKVHGPNSESAKENPDINFVVIANDENGDLYGIPSRPTKNSNHYNYELEVIKLTAHKKETLGKLLTLKIPPQIKLD